MYSLNTYISKLVEIGYTPIEAEYVAVTTAWSQIQLEDTVRCGEKLYDLEGDRVKDGNKYYWWREDNSKPAVMDFADLEVVKCDYEPSDFVLSFKVGA